jgi:hypothetical protein
MIARIEPVCVSKLSDEEAKMSIRESRQGRRGKASM